MGIQILQKVSLEAAYVMLTCRRCVPPFWYHFVDDSYARRSVSICQNVRASWVLGLMHLVHLAILLAGMLHGSAALCSLIDFLHLTSAVCVIRERTLLYVSPTDGTTSLAANLGTAEMLSVGMSMSPSFRGCTNN